MEIINIFRDKITETIKGLTGEEILISHAKESSFSDLEIDETFCMVDGELGGDYGGHVFILVTTKIATSIASLMFAEDGSAKDVMGEDELDSIKELCSNVFSAVQTDIEIENKSSFVLSIDKEIKYYQNLSEIDDIFSTIMCFPTTVKTNEGQFIVFFDAGANAMLGGVADNKSNTPSDHSTDEMIIQDYIADREIHNIKRILDIKIDLKVRIGSRKMLLRDVINMDLGSVIELDRLINEHLDIIVDGKIVGHGEVVIVDGNFGIKVTSMVDQKTRLESLRIQ